MLGGIAILFLIVALGAIIAGARGWYYSFKDRARQPCCAVCRYPVRGLQSFLCPECGSDLREGGILTPGLRVQRPLGFLSKSAYWTLVVAFVAFIATLFGEFIPGVRELHFTRVMNVSTPINGPHGAYLAAQGAARPGTGTMPPATVVTLHLPTTAGQEASFSISHEGSHSWAYFAPGKASAGRGDPTPQILAEWLAACSTTLPSSDFPSQLLDAITNAFALDSTTFSTGPITLSAGATSSWEGPAEWYQYASLAFWAVVWLAGCYLLWKSGAPARRRAKAKASAAERGAAVIAARPEDAGSAPQR